jgi:transketolase
MSEKRAMRIAYGEALAELGAVDEKVVVLDADVSIATQTCIFTKKFPERFFNAGIAEANMTGMAAGIASMGFTPFISTFAIFGAGRAYEQIRNAIVYSDFNVKVACTHGGITAGEDGASHQAIEDIALMRVLPGMTVVVPCDAIEVRKAIFAAAKHNGPMYIRIGRWPSAIITKEDTPFEIGKANVLVENGYDSVIFATGIMVPQAIEASIALRNEGINVTVVNIHTIKPLDADTVKKYALKSRKIITAEEHSVIGGLGDAISDILIGEPLKFKKVGINDRFGQSGNPDEMMEEYGLTARYIVDYVKEMQ